MTIVPLLGMPLTTTQKRAGPGVKREGLGGTWATCKVMEESLLTVYVFLSCRCLWPMFIAWVVNPPRERTTVVFLAAALAEPQYELAGIVMLKN